MENRCNVRRVPIGNTIVARWAIKTNKQVVPLEGRNLMLELIYPSGFSRPWDFTIVDTNVITFVFEGFRQKDEGLYAVNLYERRHMIGQARIDSAAFELVRHTYEANDVQNDGIRIDFDVELEESGLAILCGSPYIQDNYWYVNGINTGVQATACLGDLQIDDTTGEMFVEI